MPQEYLETLDDFGPKAITAHWPRQGTPTNVWGVGATIYKLILLTDAHHDIKEAFDNGRAFRQLETHRTPEYSRSLRALVKQCLEIDPQDRPTLQRLGDVIDRERSAFVNRWSTGGTVAERAVLRFTNRDIASMDMGPFIKRGHITRDLD